jgi:hypothetical protein
MVFNGAFMEVERPGKIRCTAARCSNKRGSKFRLCPKHSSRLYKFKDLAAYTYNLRKQRAKARNKPFSITLEEFREFCEESGYLLLKGKKAGSASIDCIVNSLGYAKGNLRMISLSDNAKKGTSVEDEDAPF